jgi:hypothetical protein
MNTLLDTIKEDEDKQENNTPSTTIPDAADGPVEGGHRGPPQVLS